MYVGRGPVCGMMTRRTGASGTGGGGGGASTTGGGGGATAAGAGGAALTGGRATTTPAGGGVLLEIAGRSPGVAGLTTTPAGGRAPSAGTGSGLHDRWRLAYLRNDPTRRIARCCSSGSGSWLGELQSWHHRPRYRGARGNRSGFRWRCRCCCLWRRCCLRSRGLRRSSGRRHHNDGCSTDWFFRTGRRDGNNDWSLLRGEHRRTSRRRCLFCLSARDQGTRHIARL